MSNFSLYRYCNGAKLVYVYVLGYIFRDTDLCEVIFFISPHLPSHIYPLFTKNIAIFCLSEKYTLISFFSHKTKYNHVIEYIDN